MKLINASWILASGGGVAAAPPAAKTQCVERRVVGGSRCGAGADCNGARVRVANRSGSMFEDTVVVDCRGHLLGRLCSIIAKELMAGQRVVLVRCEEVNISGRYGGGEGE